MLDPHIRLNGRIKPKKVKIMKIQVLILIFMLSLSSLVMSRPRGGMSLDQAVERVKHDNRGQVLSASTRRDKQHRGTHNIRVLTPNGKVKRYKINERDGKYLRSQRR